MEKFIYQEPFPVGNDAAEYRLLTKDYVSTGMFDGAEIMKVAPEGVFPMCQDTAFVFSSSKEMTL